MAKFILFTIYTRANFAQTEHFKTYSLSSLMTFLTSVAIMNPSPLPGQWKGHEDKRNFLRSDHVPSSCQTKWTEPITPETLIWTRRSRTWIIYLLRRPTDSRIYERFWRVLNEVNFRKVIIDLTSHVLLAVISEIINFKIFKQEKSFAGENSRCSRPSDYIIIYYTTILNLPFVTCCLLVYKQKKKK